MNSRHRDAVLAAFVLAALSAVAVGTGVPLSTLASPTAFLVGVGGALSLEVAMAAFPERSARLWRRPNVQLTAVLAVFVVAAAGVLVGVGDWVVASLVYGLTTYFVLLALVLTETISPPETWFG